MLYRIIGVYVGARSIRSFQFVPQNLSLGSCCTRIDILLFSESMSFIAPPMVSLEGGLQVVQANHQ